MKFEKLLIHEVEWRHTHFVIISSTEYPGLGILALGEWERCGEIKISLPGFIKTLELSIPCGCCTPHLIGNNVSCRDKESEQLRRAFIATLRMCCKKNGVTTLIFQQFYGDRLWMKQDKDGLHLIDPNRKADEIDRARFKAAFSETRLDISGFRPEDLAKY